MNAFETYEKPKFSIVAGGLDIDAILEIDINFDIWVDFSSNFIINIPKIQSKLTDLNLFCVWFFLIFFVPFQIPT